MLRGFIEFLGTVRLSFKAIRCFVIIVMIIRVRDCIPFKFELLIRHNFPFLSIDTTVVMLLFKRLNMMMTVSTITSFILRVPSLLLSITIEAIKAMAIIVSFPIKLSLIPMVLSHVHELVIKHVPMAIMVEITLIARIALLSIVMFGRWPVQFLIPVVITVVSVLVTGSHLFSGFLGLTAQSAHEIVLIRTVVAVVILVLVAVIELLLLLSLLLVLLFLLLALWLLLLRHFGLLLLLRFLLRVVILFRILIIIVAVFIFLFFVSIL